MPKYHHTPYQKFKSSLNSKKQSPPTHGGGNSQPGGAQTVWFLRFRVWSESDSVQAIDPVTGDVRAKLTPSAGDSQTQRTDALQRAERQRWGENEREEWQRGAGGAIMDEENGPAITTLLFESWTQDGHHGVKPASFSNPLRKREHPFWFNLNCRRALVYLHVPISCWCVAGSIHALQLKAGQILI